MRNYKDLCWILTFWAFMMQYSRSHTSRISVPEHHPTNVDNDCQTVHDESTYTRVSV